MLLSNKILLGRSLVFASAISVMALPAGAGRPKVYSATLASTSDGFKDLAECKTALRNSARSMVSGGKLDAKRGSLFNRAQGNISRCEMFQGEATIVVYPRGYVGTIAP